MNKINIKTWNVNWFRNQKSGEKYNIVDQNKDSYLDIINNIKSFLKSKTNSVVILQEVPFKSKKNDKWVENCYYNKLLNDFPKEEYQVVSNMKTNEYLLRGTIAILKKEENFKQITQYIPCNNRTIGLTFGSLTIIGVHMPTNFDKESKDEKMWNDLNAYIAQCNKDGKKVIITGDFNAFIGCFEKLTEDKFIELCRNAKDIVPDDVPTFIGKTAVDHLFVNYNISQNCSVKIQNELKWSDHKYIEVEIKII